MADSMDVDSEGQNGTTPSPPAQANMPGSSNTPKVTNGTSPSTPNGDAPVPPPHKSDPTSPAPAPAATSTAEDAEAFKANGNKFYKNKEYKKAIEEYTKGNLFLVCLVVFANVYHQ